MTLQDITTDVIELILNDHRHFEELMRGLRNIETDHAELRCQLAQILVAHAEAEEEAVYPQLRRKKAADAEEVEHGEHEHAEINEALLAFLQVQTLSGDTYDEKLEELVTIVNHHTNEEEQTLINDARTDLSGDQRAKLGRDFVAARQRYLDQDCGSLQHVQKVVHQTQHRLS